MRLLGELYNYEHIDSSVVFETLYLIIVFGHGTPEVSIIIKITVWLLCFFTIFALRYLVMFVEIFW